MWKGVGRGEQQDMDMQESPQNEPEDKSGIATAEVGIVMLDGPDGVAVTMTAEAADATGRALISAAEEASAQLAGSTAG
ncbi:hypothetical protein [Sphingomonas sp.]|jgi:hypothetical protein|uniref:hypothetical protein n=1 Tax=Sphingomonas sp. TaxID=28214 RepID=UPI002EDAEDAE